jgi:ectoine hydroxylase-related dioxygenase (phytanoyl-CoA dioxygenase family)
MLTQDQIAQFHEQGYVIAQGGATPQQIAALSAELDRWIEESRAYAANYGETVDGKMRFDLEPGHSATAPRLRRVANPADISEVYRAVLFDGPLVDLVAQLIGPDVKFHHCKLNNKLPGMATRVDWHQDHAYDPHSNDDVVVALLMLDDTSEANGCLMVVPGSHRERYSHYQGDRFVGATPPQHDADFARRAVPITGKAGDVCLMHTWCLHASGQNRSDAPRRLLICDYTAADAVPLRPPTVPSAHSGRIVRGKPSRIARLKPDVIELPPAYQDDSFFSVQQAKAAQG